MVSKVLFASIVVSASLLASGTVQTITFSGNVKIHTKTLQNHTRHHIGKPSDENTLRSIIEDTEAYYRKHNYALAFAAINPQETDGTINVTIGKYADFNERSIGEMKRRPLEKGSINQIFFEGNEKISTYRLMNAVSGMLGKANTPAHHDEIKQLVTRYYRSQGYTLAYATLKTIDENGVLTVEIKKYPNFKALYAHEGKPK